MEAEEGGRISEGRAEVEVSYCVCSVTTECYLRTADLYGPPRCCTHTHTCAQTHTHGSLLNVHKWKHSGAEKEEVHVLFRSYFHIIFHRFPPIFTVVVYWSHAALQTPPLQIPPSLKECAFEIHRLPSFPFHLTHSLQPGMWMAKTCKRLEGTWRKRRGGEWIRTKDGKEGGLREGALTDLLFCSSLQGCNRLLCFLRPSIPALFCTLFLRCTCYQLCACARMKELQTCSTTTQQTYSFTAQP